MYQTGRALLRYGPPILIEVLGFYTLWWSIEVEGEASVRGYVLGVTQLICATIILAWLLHGAGKRRFGAELRKLREDVDKINYRTAADDVVELINGKQSDHGGRSKIHLVEARPKE